MTTRRIADLAGTSPPAIYEFFEDKSGLVRELFFEGFRRLGATFAELDSTDDAITDLTAAVGAFRAFTLDNPHLFEIMYGQPFETFAPRPEERSVGDSTRTFILDSVERCVTAGDLVGDPVDIAHALLALAIGLANQETQGWLGRTRGRCDRRWSDGVDALLRGFAQPAAE